MFQLPQSDANLLSRPHLCEHTKAYLPHTCACNQTRAGCATCPPGRSLGIPASLACTRMEATQTPQRACPPSHNRDALHARMHAHAPAHRNYCKLDLPDWLSKTNPRECTFLLHGVQSLCRSSRPNDRKQEARTRRVHHFELNVQIHTMFLAVASGVRGSCSGAFKF